NRIRPFAIGDGGRRDHIFVAGDRTACGRVDPRQGPAHDPGRASPEGVHRCSDEPGGRPHVWRGRPTPSARLSAGMPSPARGVRAVRRRAPLWLAATCIAVCAGMAMVPQLAPYDPLRTVLLERLRPPSAKHWLGQDEVGRDILSRIIYGARISLGIGLVSVIIGGGIGGLIGILAGYFPRLGGPLIRVGDMLMAFPFILRAIAIVAILGPGFVNLFMAIAFGQIPTFARLVRGIVLGLKVEPFVESARAVGSSHLRVLFRHILPQTLAPVGTYASLGMG